MTPLFRLALGLARGLAWCATVWAAALAAAQAADAAPPAQPAPLQPAPPPAPVADFFKVPQMDRPVLSPSGQHLAVQIGAPNGRRALAVVSVDGPREARLVAGFSDGDVANVEWVNDERLVLHLVDHAASWADHLNPAMYAVNRDGSQLRRLITNVWFGAETTGHLTRRELSPYHRLLRVLRDGSPDVMLQLRRFDATGEFRSVGLVRLDTLTGIAKLVDVALPRLPRLPRQFVVDERGQPRAVRVTGGATGDVAGAVGGDPQVEVLWRDKPHADWQVVSRSSFYTLKPGEFGSMQVGADGALYVVSPSRHAGGTSTLYRFNPEQRTLADAPTAAIDGFDFQGRLLFDGRTRRLVGVRYLGDTWGTAWLDEGLKAVQARVDKRLAGTVNLIDPAECGCTNAVVVTAFSDRQPPVYFLYDREADKLELVGQAQPQIDPRRMAGRDFVRISARDGLTLPLHITRPNGKGPWPTVVLVHGGPFVRGGHWEWTAESQFLASRGYLVLEPEFRGSTGYGSRLNRAGFKQWGLTMQDDMADAARWAIAQGEADAKRLCIAGASYGGYATLMGLIKDPDLYRCGVAWLAVTDIGLMYDLHWSDLPESWRTLGMPRLIGDRVKDADQLAATSPLQQAARLKQPLLLAAGGVDRRVPIDHSLRLRKALRDHNTGLQWVEYADEGHGFNKPANLNDFWQRVERFLAQQLAP